MRIFNYVIFAAVLLVGLAGCTGTYTGGGWIDSTVAGKANFGFNVTNCNDFVKGHFNFRDKKADVMMNGDIVEFKKCMFGDCLLVDFCDFYSLVEYRSTDPKVDGGGEALVCASDDGEGANFLEYDDVGIVVLTGPYVGYLNQGKVSGNIQSHDCPGED